MVLSLAAFNLAFRLDREFVLDWDEALYGISAWEALTAGAWIGTTFQGELDYYNSKPPLNVWLIALAFKTFGASLISLRLGSAIWAWVTVAVLMVWTRRVWGASVALLSGLVLSTTFAFLHVHSGRSGNADALFTLLVLLTVVILSGSPTRRWSIVWLGPVLASAFLLKGVAVLLPLAIVAGVLVAGGRPAGGRRLPLAVATTLFALPIGAWAAARWSIDGTQFFERMLVNDLVGISFHAQDGHAGTPYYYLNVLQKHHYDWLVAAVAAWALFPATWPRLHERLPAWRSDPMRVVLVAWVSACVLIPTLMQTKLAWYLNPAYPAFALFAGASLVRGLQHASRSSSAVRGRALMGVAVLALVVAETKLVWYSFQERDINASMQSLLLAERHRLAGARVFSDAWAPGDRFVLEAVIGASPAVARDMVDFDQRGTPGDFFVGTGPELAVYDTHSVRRTARHVLYQRLDSPAAAGD